MKRLNQQLLSRACIALLLPGLAAAADPTDPQTPMPVGTDAAAANPSAPVPDPAAATQAPAATPVPVPTGSTSANAGKSPVAAAQLDEVVVTATKRPQSARDIPSSVNVIKGTELENIGARDLKDFIALVPGINTQDEIVGEQRHLSVRGVGPSDTTNQTVGIVLGDIALSDPYGALTIVDPNPWDMANIEVLKGPQGTLFGATSLAGILRYVPNAPLLDTWEAKGFAEEDHIRGGGTDPTFGAAVNIPVGTKLAFRAAGIWNHQPGVIDVDEPGRMQNNVDRSIDESGRVMGLWQPVERLTVNATYMQELRRANDTNFVTNQNGNLNRDDAPEASPVRNGFHLGVLDVRYRFNWATLASITGYQTKSSFNNEDTSFLVEPPAELGISYLHAQRQVDTHGPQTELRLTSPDGRRWTWLMGLYYSEYTAKSTAYLYVPNGGVLPTGLLSSLPVVGALGSGGLGIDASDVSINPLKAGERAFFGETNIDLFKNLRLTAGARLYRASVSGTVVASGASEGENGFTGAVQDEGFSPKLAITYRPFKPVMLYANATRGFQFGGFNNATVDLPTDHIPSTYKSSNLNNFETGFRTDWFHKTLRFDVTVFYLNWKNAQISQVTTSGISEYVDNVGVVHSRGVEGSLTYLTPIRGLTIEEDGSFIQAKTAVPFQDANGTEVPEGSIFPSSPKVQETTTLSYRVLLGPWTLNPSIIDSYQGPAFNDIEHDNVVGNYNTLNAYFNIGRNDLRFQPLLTLTATNVLNRRVIVSELGGGTSEVDTLGIESIPTVYNRPLTFSVRLSMQF